MTEYIELIKALRCIENETECDGCKYHDGMTCDPNELMFDAADTIEELQGQIDGWVEPERKALIKSLPRWIPVTERLPEKNVMVLCACRAGIYCVMKWDGVDWYENPTHVYMSGFVTHWMPLPAPPNSMEWKMLNCCCCEPPKEEIE